MAKRNGHLVTVSREEPKPFTIWSAVGEQPRHYFDRRRVGSSYITADSAHSND